MASQTKCKICRLDGKTITTEYYCTECNANLCNDCEAKHEMKPSLRNHTVILIAPIVDKGRQCSRHKNELATAWCRTCSSAICIACNLRQHDKHNTLAMKDYLTDWTTSIHSLEKKIIPLRNDILFNKNYINTLVDQLQAYMAKTENEINQHCTKIIDKITTNKSELITKLRGTIETRIQNLKNDIQLESEKITKLDKWLATKSEAFAGNVNCDFQTFVDEGATFVVLTSEDVSSGEVFRFKADDSIDVGKLEAVNMPVWETHFTGPGIGDVTPTSPTTLLATHGEEGGATLYATQQHQLQFQYQRQILQDHQVWRIALHKDVFYFTCTHPNCMTAHKCLVATHQLATSGQWPSKLFSKPSGIAVTDSGKVVVGDAVRKEVSIHQLNGTRLVTVGGNAAGSNTDVSFITPFHITTYKDSIYVADASHDTVFVLDSGGRLQYKIGTKGSSDGQFDKPRGMCFTDLGKLLVVDRANNRVSQFNPDGTFISHVITKQTDVIGQPWFISFLKCGNKRFICLLDLDDKWFMRIFNI